MVKFEKNIKILFLVLALTILVSCGDKNEISKAKLKEDFRPQEQIEYGELVSIDIVNEKRGEDKQKNLLTVDFIGKINYEDTQYTKDYLYTYKKDGKNWVLVDVESSFIVDHEPIEGVSDEFLKESLMDQILLDSRELLSYDIIDRNTDLKSGRDEITINLTYKEGEESISKETNLNFVHGERPFLGDDQLSTVGWKLEHYSFKEEISDPNSDPGLASDGEGQVDHSQALIGTNKYVTASPANVRSGPGFDYEVVGTVNYGAMVYIFNIHDADDRTWCQISKDGIWISINNLADSF